MAILVQTLLIVIFAPLLQGAMKRLRGRLQGRPGASIVQPYRDLAKLWKKEALLPEGTSIVALCAPGIAVGVALAFAAAVPLTSAPLALVDVVALAFLLAIGRFALTLAALDMRSAFTGMAASREMTFASLTEPALLLALLGGAVAGKGSGLDGIAAAPFGIASALAVAAIFLVLLLETARVPIDNQETHYELTMIHEGLSLEYSGWHLALVQSAAYVRQLAFLLLASLLLPGAGLIAHAGWVLAFAVAITAVETSFAKVRLFEIPALLTSAFILAAASIGLRLAGMGS
jgi:formate hydrogenlyase subunit 4